MSLTTAVSEDDEAESVHTSPYKVMIVMMIMMMIIMIIQQAKQSGAGASFNCTGAVRKPGFLSVKKWLLRKKHQVELARKRGWKGYWVCLKGTTLLFYPCDSREVNNVTITPSDCSHSFDCQGGCKCSDTLLCFFSHLSRLFSHLM